MEFGAPFPWGGPMATPDNVIRVAKAAERLGYSFISVGEHWLYPKRMEAKYPYSPTGALAIDPRDPNLEIFTCLAFVASHTTRLRLRTGLVVLPYRSPFLTAKQAATLDVLSKGRVILGVGAGWMKDEFDVLKVPFAERGAMTDEYIQVIRALWSKQPAFHGTYFQFKDIYVEPKPVQQPLPIWVGGGTPAAIRRAARLSDGWFPIGVEAEEVERQRDLLRKHLREAGRKEEDVHISGSMAIDFESGRGFDATRRRGGAVLNKPDLVLEETARWTKAGAKSLYLRMGDVAHLPPERLIERMEWFAHEVMTKARAM